MKNILKFALGVAGVLSLSPMSHATVLLALKGGTIPSTAPTQMGRIPTIVEDNHNAQDWFPQAGGNGEVAYPTPVDPTTAYQYTTYTFTAAQLGNGKYVEITFNKQPGGSNLFVSAWTSYAGTTSVASGAGWLGDSSYRKNFFSAPNEPRYFDVTVPKGASLVVVVNTTDTTGTGEPYDIQVDAYSTKDYSDITVGSSVPASSAPKSGVPVGEIVLLGGVAVAGRRRRQAAVA